MFTWIKAAPWIVISVLILLLISMTNLYLGKRDELAAFRATVQTLGEQAAANVKRIEQQSKDNLKKVTDDYERKIPAIRAGAVAAYKLRYPNASSCTLPDNGPGKPLDDAASPQCVPDSAFIESAADDAAKVSAWQAWCILNQCPVQ